MDKPSASAPPGDAATRARPTHAPLWITILAIVIATGLASALVYVLLNETTGPGEVLHDFYVALDEGDCQDAAALTSGVDEATLCANAASAVGTIPDNPRIDSITLEGEGGSTAVVRITEEPGAVPVEWQLDLIEGAWRITTCPTTGALADVC